MNNWLTALLAGSILLLSNHVQGQQQDDHALVLETLTNYIDGSSYNDQVQIQKAFASDADLLLERDKEEIWTVPIKEYLTWFNPAYMGQFNGRVGNVLSVDIDGRMATAKVEILIPKKSVRFVDVFLLKKLDSGWKIITKAAAKETANNNGERILFIVSSAHFHGDSKIPAGVSFSELAKAYEVFVNAGYDVDVMSPEGGAIPLSYINTSDQVHKKYLYDNDFMQALKYTLTPKQVEPANYRAVHYIGGSNAMYQVADHPEIQKIAMSIYEDHNGIISSVCHGTAGIVNLKTKDGKYLVAGKRISGYPEAYEARNRDYFKQFPFMIQQTIEQHGGKFFYSERNTPHVEVDGRIVTGQNHLSSDLVAQKMLEILAQG